MSNWESNSEDEVSIDWGKPCINQHEMAHIMSMGLPSSILDGFTVIQTEEVDMEWTVDGITLREAVMFNDRTTGFRILYRNLMGPDRNDHIDETVVFMKHHWPAWRATAGVLGDL